jgi:hypothetical protein
MPDVGRPVLAGPLNPVAMLDKNEANRFFGFL